MHNPSNLTSEAENSHEETQPEVNVRKFQVFCRVRPLQETQLNQDIVISENKPTITIYNHAKHTSKVFTFHKIYHETFTQSQITEELSNEIYSNCRSNGNGCLVLSYGVTNSGKTYTILGTPQQPGLLPILINKLSQKMPEQKIYISAVENYIDEFYSLKNKEKLYLKEKDYKFQFQTYQPQEINKDNFSELINTYIHNRNQNGTHANMLSSRSHAIFKIYCSTFYIVIVDLAGSQRLQKANSDQQETIAINNSLFSLGRCIHAFQKGDKVPYRDHKLTQMFVQFFNPNYKIIMIAHINRSGNMFHQNINVLEYAALSTQIKQLNTHKNKSILKSASKFKNYDRSLQKKMHTKDIENKQSLLENYKFFIKGINFQFQNNLDRHLQEQDKKDRQFLQQLKEGSYISPAKNPKLELERMKVESRIKFREMVIQDLAAQKRQKMVECGTLVGSSLRKPYEASIRKRLQEQIMKKLHDNSKESQQFQRQISQALQSKEQIQSKPIFTQTAQVEQRSLSQPQTAHFQPEKPAMKVQTPIKFTNKVQTESFFKRLLKSPAMYIKSSTVAKIQDMCKNFFGTFQQKAEQIMQIFKQMGGKSQHSAIKQKKQASQKAIDVQQIQKQAVKGYKKEIVDIMTHQNANLEVLDIKKEPHQQDFVSCDNKIKENSLLQKPFSSRQSSIKEKEVSGQQNTNLSDIIHTNNHPNNHSNPLQAYQEIQMVFQRKSDHVQSNELSFKAQESNELLLNDINYSDQKQLNNYQTNNIITHIKETQTIIYAKDYLQPRLNDTPSFPQNCLPSHQNQLQICDKENTNQINDQPKEIPYQAMKESKISKNFSTQETTYVNNVNKSAFKYVSRTQTSRIISKNHSPAHSVNRVDVSQKKKQMIFSQVPKSGIKTRNQLRNNARRQREVLKRKI